MTAVAGVGADERLLHLVAHSPQLDDWAETLHRLGTDGRRLAVAHGPNRKQEARRLAGRFESLTAPLGASDRIRRHLADRDLLIVITSAVGRAQPIQAVNSPSPLHELLLRGVVIWGITGPRPGPVAHYCHDVIAVPTPDPLLLLRSHRLVIRRLTLPSPESPPLAVVRNGERSRPCGT